MILRFLSFPLWQNTCLLKQLGPWSEPIFFKCTKASFNLHLFSSWFENGGRGRWQAGRGKEPCEQMWNISNYLLSPLINHCTSHKQLSINTINPTLFYFIPIIMIITTMIMIIIVIINMIIMTVALLVYCDRWRRWLASCVITWKRFFCGDDDDHAWQHGKGVFLP